MIIINEKIEILVNDCYKVLNILYDNHIIVNKEPYCPLSQNEIAEILKLNRMTIANILKKLESNGLIIIDKNKNKKYILTEKGIDVIKKMNKI